MHNQERQQQRLIVGWWLDVPPTELIGTSLDGHLEEIRTVFNRAVIYEELSNLGPERARDSDLKARLYRVEQALAGVSFRALARQDDVTANAVRETIKDTFARLKCAQNRDSNG